MGLLIDASLLLEHGRDRIDLEQGLDEHAGESFYISVITIADLLDGTQRASRPRARAVRAAFVEGVIMRFPLLAVDLETARAYARLRLELGERRVEQFSTSDLWLAATAVAHGLTLVTGSPRDLARIPGVAVESWLAS